MTQPAKRRSTARRAVAVDRPSNRAPIGPSAKLSHLDADGAMRMVDVTAKGVTSREASASGVVCMRADVLDKLLNGMLPKGDAIAAARIAGILAAKRTGEWIPLCHPLPLEWVHLEFSRRAPNELSICCTAKTSAKTGVEMEALTAVAAAALTVYDMAKSADRSIVIGPIQLERKSGGNTGDWNRSDSRLVKPQKNRPPPA